MNRKKREENEKKFTDWKNLEKGGRIYWFDIAGKLGWKARYVKVVDEDETTQKFYQEIYNEKGKLVEIQEKYPIDKGHTTMNINKKIIAAKLQSYLQHKISINHLVEWAENVIMEGHFQNNESKVLREVLGKIGLADVKSFGLNWDDCEKLIRKLGYKVKIEISQAA